MGCLLAKPTPVITLDSPKLVMYVDGRLRACGLFVSKIATKLNHCG